MSTVAVHPPKTPVTKGSSSVATATMPNVCKMPGPPAPFVPTPLPNIGDSGKQPKGYSKKVKIEGEAVGIQGASFGSSGDIASKGTGGGLVSNNAEGETKFVAPGSLSVSVEGKNVQLLGDQMLNNCGPGGSPPNSATMGGVLHGPVIADAASLGVLPEVWEVCEIHCKCVKDGDSTQGCIWRELWARDKALLHTRRSKAEVPYNMRTNPPTPFMSKKEPRQTHWWGQRGHKRPDVVIVNNPFLPWMGENIAAVVECKWGTDNYANITTRSDYAKIAGGDDKLLELDDRNCRCSGDNDPDPPPYPVPWLILAAAATLIGALALAAAAAGSAPVWAPAAAAVAVLGFLGFGSSRASGGNDVV